MSSIDIATKEETFSLEVGENDRAFLGLYNLTHNELCQREMNTEAVTSLLVKYSGADPQMAGFFVTVVADLAEGKEPPSKWGIWAGEFARKFSAEKCKKDMKPGVVMGFVGLAGCGLIAWLKPGFDNDSFFQTIMLIFSLVAFFGMYRAALLGMDLFHFRGGDWPFNRSTSSGIGKSVDPLCPQSSSASGAGTIK